MVVAASVPPLTAMPVNVLLPESVCMFAPSLVSIVPARLPENVGLLPLLLPSVRFVRGTLLESFSVMFTLPLNPPRAKLPIPWLNTMPLGSFTVTTLFCRAFVLLRWITLAELLALIVVPPVNVLAPPSVSEPVPPLVLIP